MQIHVNCRKCRARRRSNNFPVVEADNSNIGWHADAPIAERVNDPTRDLIVSAEYSVGCWPRSENTFNSLMPPRLAPTAEQHAIGMQAEPSFLERLLQPLPTVLHRIYASRTCNMNNGRATDAMKMFTSEIAATQVIGKYTRASRIDDPRERIKDRYLLALKIYWCSRPGPRSCDDDAIHSVSKQGVDVLPLSFRIASGIAQEYRYAFRIHRVLNALQNGNAEAAMVIGRYQSDRVAMAPGKRASHFVGPEMEFLGYASYYVACLSAKSAGAVEGFRNGAEADAGGLGHIVNSDGS